MRHKVASRPSFFEQPRFPGADLAAVSATRGRRGAMGRRATVDLIAKVGLATMLVLGSIGLTPPALFPGKGTFAEDTGGGALLKQLIYLALLGISVMLFSLYRQQRPSWRVFGPLLLGLGWCWISMAWADFPEIAIRRLLSLTITMVVTVGLLLTLTRREAISYLPLLFAGLLIANTVAILLLPGATTVKADFDHWSGDSGTWRGLHLQKNVAGAVGAFGVLLFIYRAATEKAARGLWIALALFGVFFVLKTGSKTSFGLVFICSAAGWIIARVSGSPRRQLLITLLVIAALAAVPILAPSVLAIFPDFVSTIGQEPDAYTGRVQIWEALARYVRDHFMLGSGYGSFWRVGENGAIYQYARDWLLTIPQAHNGYLDLLVQLGIFGLVIGVVSAIFLPLYVTLGRSDLSREARWFLTSAILFFACHNMLESSLFDRDNPNWFMLLCCIALIGGRSPRTSLLTWRKP